MFEKLHKKFEEINQEILDDISLETGISGEIVAEIISLYKKKISIKFTSEINPLLKSEITNFGKFEGTEKVI